MEKVILVTTPFSMLHDSDIQPVNKHLAEGWKVKSVTLSDDGKTAIFVITND